MGTMTRATVAGELPRLELRVDETACTGCGLCEEIAMENIEVPVRTDIAVITRQPTTLRQWQDCMEAVRECPAEGLTVHAPDTGDTAAAPVPTPA